MPKYVVRLPGRFSLYEIFFFFFKVVFVHRCVRFWDADKPVVRNNDAPGTVYLKRKYVCGLAKSLLHFGKIQKDEYDVPTSFHHFSCLHATHVLLLLLFVSTQHFLFTYIYWGLRTAAFPWDILQVTGVEPRWHLEQVFLNLEKCKGKKKESQRAWARKYRPISNASESTFLSTNVMIISNALLS